MFNREHVTDAIAFWERGRLFYNLALAAISIVVLAAMKLRLSDWADMTIPLLVLAVLANVIYCVVYPIDVFVQASDFRDAWRSVRWGLLAFGTLFGAILAYLILGGPYVFGPPEPHVS